MFAYRLPTWIAKRVVWVCFVATILSSSHAASVLASEITYAVLPVGLGDSTELAGGTITTDGTLGLLSPENIVSMRVDLELNGFVFFGEGQQEPFDGSTTLDLTNATLSIDGEVLATPNGIFVVLPPLGPDPFIIPRDGSTFLPTPNPDSISHSITLAGEDGGASWSASNTESRGERFSLGLSSRGAGLGLILTPESGLIARVIPETSTASLLLLGLSILSKRRRR